MSFNVIWTKRAAKELLSVPKKQCLMIVKWVQENLQGCANPKAIPGSKAIQGSQQGWRYRVGSYRILARIEEDELVIEVVRVGHRQGVYQNLPKMRDSIFVAHDPLIRAYNEPCISAVQERFDSIHLQEDAFKLAK